MTKSKSRNRSQKGGGALPPSAWGNVLETAGNGWQQFMNTLSLNNPSQSNVLALQNTSRSGNNVGNTRTMKGGRSRRGGNLVPVLNQAAVPLTLLAMNQYAKRKHKSSKRRSFKRRSFKRRR
jgi:hypothetical protein